MSSRTTAAAVKAIMDTAVTEDQIGAVLDDAYNLVTAYLGNQSIGDALLASIEKWVAAHMVAVGLDAQYSQETAKGVGGTRAGQYGKNFQMTSYGQMACALDTTGTLAAAGGRSVQLFSVPSYDWKNG